MRYVFLTMTVAGALYGQADHGCFGGCGAGIAGARKASQRRRQRDFRKSCQADRSGCRRGKPKTVAAVQPIQASRSTGSSADA